MLGTTRPGCESTCELRIGDVRREIVGAIVVEEDLAEGVRLRVEVGPSRAPAPRPGEELSLSVVVLDDEGRLEASFALWVHRVERIVDPQGTRFIVQATDLLSLVDAQPQFLSRRPGGCSLSQLVRSAIAPHTGFLKNSPAWGQQDPVVRGTWLLQAGETSREFLLRVAWTLGGVLFWQRDRLVWSRLGIPGPDAGRISLGAHLVERVEIDGLDLDGGDCRSVDPTTRAVTRAPAEGSIGSEAVALRQNGARAGHEYSVALTRGPRRFGHLLSARTIHPAVTLGTLLELDPGQVARVEQVVHEFSDGGRSYCNHLLALPVRRWGLGSAPPRSNAIGPFQARIFDNVDPRRQGRVRVVLEEDRAAQPSPWIPTLSGGAGIYGGIHWIPEKEERVLVIAEESSPEELVCLGALRGSNQALDANRSTERNRMKSFITPGGLTLEFDDETKCIRLRAGDASLELDQRGKLSLRGIDVELAATEKMTISGTKHTEVRSAQEIEIAGGQKLVQEAKRIHIG